MQAAANRRGIRLRPHVKTHKSPIVARWQLERGAAGICCAKIGEAEVFAEAGFDDIRLAYPIHPTNAARVARLLGRTRLSFIVDHLTVAQAWSEAMTSLGREVEVLVKVDVGFHRCGIAPDEATAIGFITRVASLPGLRLRGLLSHAGHGYHAASPADLRAIAEREAGILRALAAAAREAGVAIEETSAGATPTARYSLEIDGLTEYRPGNYVYYDRTQIGLGSASLDDCALTVLATVVSAPASDRIVLDCGSKTLSADLARGFTPLPGHGTVLRAADLTPEQEAESGLIVERLSEEHATVRVGPGAPRLEPGARVRIVPNHACVVSNLVDRASLVEGERVVDEVPIAARGRMT
jgi:D-serine deaminase-like pyridoxal phosphate-dependent protein